MKNLLTQALYLIIFSFAINTKIFAQQEKYALIIGVKSYQYVQPLQNSLNDALDMAATLKKKGFTVVEIYDPATKRVMQDGILKYFKLLQDKPNATGLVFYSGHGMQVKGVNYLIPTQADPQIEADLDDQCVNMDYVMRAIEQAGNELNIFVLDACRNNPFRSFSRSGEKGLSMVDTPKGSYIVYSTKPGSVASDGTGRNGLFTSKLLQYINTEGLNIEQVFKQVARDVATASGDAQRPWIASDYTGDFFFTPGVSAATMPVAQPTVTNEATPVEPEVAPLDYGYGTADAPTIKIGTQEWMSKNLNVDRFANGDLIPEARTIDEWKEAKKNKKPAWCFYFNKVTNGSTYGRLYNWYAVNDPRGLAPKGWHVPSDEEWRIMTDNLGGETIAGLYLKSSTGWDKDGNGNNKSGISGLPGGYRDSNGIFSNLGVTGKWWSSSQQSQEEAWYRHLNFHTDIVNRISERKGYGYSVRCIRLNNEKSSLINVSPQVKETDSNLIAEKNNIIVSIKDNNIYKGTTLIGSYTIQNTNNTSIYKVVNSSGSYIAVLLATLQSATSGPSISKIEIYKAYDVVSISTPLKVIENKNYDRPSQIRDKAIRWLIDNKLL